MTKDRLEEDRVQVVWDILGGEGGVDRLIRGEIMVSEPERSWREKEGVIYFSVESEGTTGYGWVARLESKGFRLSDYAKRVLRFSSFVKPKNGGVYKIAVLKGSLFSDNDRVTENIRAEAGKRGLMAPKAEVACLICEKFTDKELEDMGLWWIAIMHNPIKDSTKDFGGGDPSPLYVGRCDGGGRCLSAFFENSSIGWLREVGFAFVIPQV